MATLQQNNHEKMYDTSADVNTFADQIGVSRRWLHEQCVRNTGKTPKKLLEEARMKKALELLCSDNTVDEIAASVGYAYTKTFSEAFKRCFGMPPGEWRRKNLPPPTSIMPE